MQGEVVQREVDLLAWLSLDQPRTFHGTAVALPSDQTGDVAVLRRDRDGSRAETLLV